MSSYEKSKIYIIEPTVPHDDNEVYIGSTTQDRLCQRMVKHRCDYKRFVNGLKPHTVSAFKLFDKYGVNNLQIRLIEEVNVKNKDELHAIEGHYIKTTPCVNLIVAGRSNSQYRIDNKESIKERDKIYRMNNKEEIKNKLYWKTYASKYPERVQESYLRYKNSHSEKIKCQCGSVVAKYNLTKQHIKTNKHQTYLQNNINTTINETD